MREEHVLSEELTGAKGEVADWFTGELGRELHPPLLLWMQQPAVARTVLELGHYARYVALDYRQREMIIMTVAQHHDVKTAWDIHYPTAIESGASEDALREIERGGIPTDITDVETCILKACRRLLEVNRLSDDEYAELKDAVGVEGIVEVVAV
ncbi:MAG TPA: hypothetical protein DCE33_06810, partial [Rhodospirillaceae bacterium]|nr:hypothetical protein [Rhodospirillaceae bacterium]